MKRSAPIRNKPRPCKNPECNHSGFYPSGYCSPPCLNACKPKVFKPRTAIRKTSKKKAAEDKVYTDRRKLFLAKPENCTCYIKGCARRATTIDHRMGREGYADDWARYNNVSLYLDERYWAGCCLEHNLELENNSELAKLYHLSKIHGGKME